MAEEETTDKAEALRRAVAAHRKFTEASDSAESWRTIRLGAMVLAVKAGVSQVELAEAFGMSQAAVSSILKRGAVADS
ncbi:MAG: hypothetical protein AAGE88_18265 [Actinomycetota bacterium]